MKKDKNNTVTCSFSMDRELYNTFKGIISRDGETVKGSIIQYMMNVIRYDTPNSETIAAIEEVEKMKATPSIGKAYHTFAELLREIEDVVNAISLPIGF